MAPLVATIPHAAVCGYPLIIDALICTGWSQSWTA